MKYYFVGCLNIFNANGKMLGYINLISYKKETIKNRVEVMLYAFLWYAIVWCDEWDLYAVIWDINDMLWYGVCCKKYDWIECTYSLVQMTTRKLESSDLFQAHHHCTTNIQLEQ